MPRFDGGESDSDGLRVTLTAPELGGIREHEARRRYNVRIAGRDPDLRMRPGTARRQIAGLGPGVHLSARLHHCSTIDS